MAGTNNQEVSFEKLKLLMSDLEGYRADDILIALKTCRFQLPKFPSLSEIISRIPNGHPGVNEAWALCPKNESDSACWTKQIKDAFYKAYDLCDDRENIQMRMAFIECYQKIMAEAIQNKTPVKWELNLGWDKSGRESCILENVKNGRIGHQELKKVEHHVDLNVLKLLEEKTGNKILKEIANV